jgi:hypothetical protein
MRQHLISRKVLFATASAFVVALGFMTTGAMASPPAHSENSQLSHRVGHFAARHGRHIARREAMPVFGRNDIPGYIYEPGYIYLPKKGIVDEACNLPTSACPNEMRDVQ